MPEELDEDELLEELEVTSVSCVSLADGQLFDCMITRVLGAHLASTQRTVESHALMLLHEGVSECSRVSQSVPECPRVSQSVPGS